MVELLDKLDRLESLDLLSLLKSDPEREYAFRHVFRRKYLFVEAVRNQALLFMNADSNGDTRERLSAGREFRCCLAMAAAKVSLVREKALAHNQQSAVLACLPRILERFIQFF